MIKAIKFNVAERLLHINVNESIELLFEYQFKAINI